MKIRPADILEETPNRTTTRTSLNQLMKEDTTLAACIEDYADNGHASASSIIAALVDRFEAHGHREDFLRVLRVSACFDDGSNQHIAMNSPSQIDPMRAQLLAQTLRETLIDEADQRKRQKHGLVRVLKSFDSYAGNRDVAAQLKKFKALLDPLPLLRAPDPNTFSANFLSAHPKMGALSDVVKTQARLAYMLGDGRFKLPPTLLVGPPGAGKSYAAEALLKTADIPYQTISAAGASDARFLAGTARGWSSAEPSAPAKLMLSSGHANPALIIDEIDKAGGSDRNGRLTDALLPILEPTTARQWMDEYLGAALDLSHMSIIMTANSTEQLPEPFRSRSRIIEVDRPQPKDLPTILNAMANEIAQSFGAWDETFLSEEETSAIVGSFGGQPVDLRQVRPMVERVLETRLEGPVFH